MFVAIGMAIALTPTRARHDIAVSHLNDSSWFIVGVGRELTYKLTIIQVDTLFIIGAVMLLQVNQL